MINFSKCLLFSALFFVAHGDMWAMEAKSKATDQEFEEKHQDQGDSYFVDNQRNTFLHKAAAQGKLKFVKQFIRMGVPINVQNAEYKISFDLAREAKHVEVCELLQINFDLLDSALLGNFDGVKKALKAGAVVDVRDFCQATPLFWAADKGFAEIVQFLIDAGADKNIADYKGRTALAIAKENRNLYEDMGKGSRAGSAKLVERVERLRAVIALLEV